MQSYKIIQKKLEAFIRKYYLKKMVKGVIFSVTTLLLLALVMLLPETWFYFGENVRMIFFYGFILVGVGLLTSFILLPALKMARLHKGINQYEAAKIIGDYFPEVKDKLLNVIQLRENRDITEREAELINASIEQRSAQLSVVPFKNAVELKETKRYLFKVAPLLLLMAFLMLIFPKTFKESAGRIVNYSEHFEKPQPFYFKIENDSLTAVQNNDFEIRVTTNGQEIPDKVYLISEDSRMLMNKTDKNQWKYTFRGLNSDKYFSLNSGKIKSSGYHIKVHPLPTILEFEISLEYPDYTGKQNEKIKNSGDIFVPEGTNAHWSFFTRDMERIIFRYGDSTYSIKNNASNKFEFEKQVFQSNNYQIWGSNQFLITQDTAAYKVNIIKDQYPEISVKELSDSIDMSRHYFTGIIKDDYGLGRLLFQMKVIKNNDTTTQTSNISITRNSKQRFYYSATFDSLKLNGGDMVRYYFQVYDNDRINGPKSSQSRIFSFRQPTKSEISEKSKKSNETINKELSSNRKKAEKFNTRLEDIKSDLMNKNKLNWDDKKKLKDALEDLEEMKKGLENIKKESEYNRKLEEQFNQTDKELLDKQKQLEELMEKVLDEEVKKLMDEIRKMMEKLDKDNMNKLLDKMDMTNKALKDQLDRSIELFKQLQFQKDLQDAIDEAAKLSEDQKKLQKQTENVHRKDIENLSPKQQELKSDLDSLARKLEQMERDDKTMKNPNGFKAPEKKTEDIKKEMEESIQNLENRMKNNAGDRMKKAGDKLFQLKSQLQRQQQQMKQKRLGEDIDNLKQILENLVDISFEQESLISNFKTINKNDPKYVEQMQEQFGLKEKLEKVKDSLKALSERQAMIQPFVMREIKSIDRNMEKSLNQLKERNVRSASSRQQYVMTHVNNLSLLLSEALDNMKQNMSSMGSGKGGSKKQQPVPKMSEIRKMQEQLQQQLQQMKKEMGQKGQKGQNGKQKGMSEKLARMAAKQAAIRRKLQKYREEMIKQGKGGQGMNKTIKKMDENETDMVNKRITEELIQRQKEIVTRLLESEKAEREQDKEKKREAEHAKSYEKRNPNQFLEYKEIKMNNKEVLKTMPPELHPYYRNRINDYFIEEQKDN